MNIELHLNYNNTGNIKAATGGYLCFRDNQLNIAGNKNTYTQNDVTMQPKATAKMAQILFKGLCLTLLAFCASLTCAAQTTTKSEAIAGSSGAPVIVPLDPNASKVAVKVPALVNTQPAQAPAALEIKPAEQKNEPKKKQPDAPKAPAAVNPQKPSVN